MAKPTSDRADIQEALDRLSRAPSIKREIDRLVEKLDPDERVLGLASAIRKGGKQGLLVLSSRRLLFVVDGLLTAQTEDFPVAALTSVVFRKGVMLSALVVTVAGNAEAWNIGSAPDGERMASQIKLAMRTVSDTASTAPGAAAGPASVVDPLEQLKKLGELRDAGVLTLDEFEAKKAEILARI